MIGAGAVGLGVASCLLAGGVGVRLFVRDRQSRDALASKGIHRSGLFGEVQFGPDRICVETDLLGLEEGDEELWLVCVKSAANLELARKVGAHWRKRAGAPGVVLFQNGWGNAETYAAVIPPRHIFNARVITGFERLSISQVEITVHADSIHIGSLFGAPLDSILPLCRAIHSGGIPCEPSLEIEKDLWAKLLYNVLLNPLGALVGVPYGFLAKHPETRAIMRGLAEEVFSLLDASGHCTHWQSAEEYLSTFYGKLLPPTEKHESSMLQDLRSGRLTEIDALCGAVCQLAEAHQLSVPLNEALTVLIHAAETRRL